MFRICRASAAGERPFPVQKLSKKGGKAVEAWLHLLTSKKGIGFGIAALAVIAGLFLQYVRTSPQKHPCRIRVNFHLQGYLSVLFYM